MTGLLRSLVEANEYEIKCPAAAEAPIKEKPNCRQSHMKIKMHGPQSCATAETAEQI